MAKSKNKPVDRRNFLKGAAVGAAVRLMAVMLLSFSSFMGAAAQDRPNRVLTGPADNTAPAGNVENGKASFTSRNCATCHGADAQGTDGGGPRIGPPPMAFPDFVQYVRMPTGNMPPVSAQRVPDSELADIYAYLSTMGSSAQGSGAPAAVFSIGPRNRDNGKKIFSGYGCFECRGYEGQGSKLDVPNGRSPSGVKTPEK